MAAAGVHQCLLPSCRMGFENWSFSNGVQLNETCSALLAGQLFFKSVPDPHNFELFRCFELKNPALEKVYEIGRTMQNEQAKLFRDLYGLERGIFAATCGQRKDWIAWHGSRYDDDAEKIGSILKRGLQKAYSKTSGLPNRFDAGVYATELKSLAFENAVHDPFAVRDYSTKLGVIFSVHSAPNFICHRVFEERGLVYKKIEQREILPLSVHRIDCVSDKHENRNIICFCEPVNIQYVFFVRNLSVDREICKHHVENIFATLGDAKVAYKRA